MIRSWASVDTLLSLTGPIRTYPDPIPPEPWLVSEQKQICFSEIMAKLGHNILNTSLWNPSPCDAPGHTSVMLPGVIGRFRSSSPRWPNQGWSSPSLCPGSATLPTALLSWSTATLMQLVLPWWPFPYWLLWCPASLNWSHSFFLLG